MNRFHTSRALEVLIDFILWQNGRKRFHKTGARRFWKRFSVLLNFYVPPRLKIPAMSPWSTIDFILLMKMKYELISYFQPARMRIIMIQISYLLGMEVLWNDFVLLCEQSANSFHINQLMKYELLSYFFDTYTVAEGWNKYIILIAQTEVLVHFITQQLKQDVLFHTSCAVEVPIHFILQQLKKDEMISYLLHNGSTIWFHTSAVEEGWTISIHLAQWKYQFISYLNSLRRMKWFHTYSCAIEVPTHFIPQQLKKDEMISYILRSWKRMKWFHTSGVLDVPIHFIPQHLKKGLNDLILVQIHFKLHLH